MFDLEKNMGAIRESKRKLDVICQHKSDGSIIPIKFRIQDDDGEWQNYLIRSYKVISSPGTYTMPNDVSSSSHTWNFECKIQVFGMEKIVRLFYNGYDNHWKLQFIR